MNSYTMDTVAPRAETLSWLDALCRKAVFRLLAGVREGEIVVVEGGNRRVFGRMNPHCALHVEIVVRRQAFYKRVALGGSLGAGEAFVDGDWTCDNLTSLIRIFVRQLDLVQAADRGWARLTRPLKTAYHWARRNTISGSRRNVSEHYDLGNEFFSLFLDPTMTYSCALFESEHTTLEQASIAKIDRICRKLELNPDDHLLEIGTGWGGLAIHAARGYQCRVTTTTISRRQHELARQRVRQAGLEDRITLLLKDYRELEGTYDKCASVEMIEAVGHQYYDTFFSTCSRLLAPQGLMLLQAITIGDHRYEAAKNDVDFIKRYIFPGSCIPSVARMGQSLSHMTDMRLVHLEDITPHYATTLRIWRENFNANRDLIRRTGATERFLRLWTYYLAYCEGGFAERYLGNVQMLLAKPGFRGTTVVTEWPHPKQESEATT